MQNHPDKLGLKEDSEVWKIANDYIKLLNEAYSVLSDPILKNKYDGEYYHTENNQDYSDSKKANILALVKILKEIHR